MTFFDRISRPPRSGTLFLTAAVLLIGIHETKEWLVSRALELGRQEVEQEKAVDQMNGALNHYSTLRDLKLHDVNQFRNGMSQLARTNKGLFESGLSLQEEKRLLEKQWEIMTTYLYLDPALRRITLMRGDQPLESYPVRYYPPEAFAISVSSAPAAKLPAVVRIVSKERFAAPERGQSAMVDGRLEWTPPQVGTSVRSNALGEFVMFTSSRLILHGPPVKTADHAQYPHYCLGLSREAARLLYRHSFVGTKIMIPSKEKT
jgi:hypothetical protein